MELKSDLLISNNSSLFISVEWASQVVLIVKNLPANIGDKETQVQPLGWEDPLDKVMATHCSPLA